MTNAFDKVVTELWKTGMLTKSDFQNHPSELTKVILALLLTVLVEHGQLADYRRYIGESGQMTGTLCDIANFPEYCPKLGQIMDYNKWTHHILYIISLLRNNQMFDFHSGGPVSYELNLAGTSPTFLSNAMLLLYAFLFIRLILAASNLPGKTVRYDVEACMFAAILSFYYDYVQYTKGLFTIPNAHSWENLKKQVVNMYLAEGRFFFTLKLQHPFQSYLQEDVISTAYSCILSGFIDQYKGAIKGGLLSGKPDPMGAMKCLHNVNLNSLSVMGSRWFRKLLNNRVTRGVKKGVAKIKNAGLTVYGVGKETYAGLQDAYVFGEDVTVIFPTDKWPRASKTAAVTVSLVAFAGRAGVSYVKTMVRADWKMLTALAYSFRKQELNLSRPMADMQFEKPLRPAYLRWDRSPNGKFSVIYNITPLPGVPMDPNAPFNYIQRGGSAAADVKNMEDLIMLQQALKKRYVKTELAPEVAAVIKKRLEFTTKMTGGGRQYGGASFENAPRLEDEDPLPQGWTSQIIDNAEEESFLREDEDGETVQLVLVKPPMEDEAIKMAAFVREKDSKTVSNESLHELPDTEPELNPNEPTLPLNQVTKVHMDAPPPPVDPIVSLPTISNDEKEGILASTSVPSPSKAAAVVEDAEESGVQPVLSPELNQIALTVPVKRTFTVVSRRKSRSRSRGARSRSRSRGYRRRSRSRSYRRRSSRSRSYRRRSRR